MNEKKTITITHPGGSQEEIPILDLNEIMKQHMEKFPIKLSNGTGLAFGYPSATKQKEINATHYDYLRDYHNNAIATVLKIMNDKPADKTMMQHLNDLSSEDAAFLHEYETRSFPYQAEMIHSMLIEPKLSLEEFKRLIDILPDIDWINIQDHCRNLMEKWAEKINTKN